MGEQQDAVRQILKDSLHVETDKISDKDPLFSSGLIDSFALLELITHLETKFSITIKAEDTKLENLDSISGILALVDARSSAAG